VENPAKAMLGLDVTDDTYFGTGDFQDLVDSDKCHAVLLPVAMLLPFVRGIPMGQIFPVDGGAAGFRRALIEMIGEEGEDANINQHLEWTQASSYFTDWLDAMAANPQKFMITFLA
jgi:hypothetical protein